MGVIGQLRSIQAAAALASKRDGEPLWARRCARLAAVPTALIVVSISLCVHALTRERHSESWTRNNLGNAFYAKGNYEAAEAHFAAALKLDPADDEAHNNLGKVLSRRGKHQEAVAHYAEALKLNPGSVDAHNNLGVDLQAQGNYQAAAAQFTEALRLNPNYGDAYLNLGNVLFGFGKYEAAAAHFAEALRLNPGYENAHFNLGVALFNLGEYEAATTCFAEARRLQPSDPDAYNASALLLAACPDAKFRNGKQAVQLATYACELTNGKNPSCLNTLAAAQAEAGDFDAAVLSQQKAIELLTDEHQKGDYRSRLVLYRSKKPFRQVPVQRAATQARP